MRASEFITEVFQPGKTNWKWRRQSSDEAFASFVVGDREYQWHAVHWCPDPTKWEIQFRLMREKTDPDGLDLFGRTGTGNSAQVLSTAVDITREFIKQYGIDKVKEIKFNAKEDSRIGLYAKMIQRLLPDWDLYQKYTKYNGMEYRLTDPRAYDKPENKITEGQGVAEGKLNEIRDQLWTWVQSKFPRTQWPEYVQRDFLYQQAKGIRNQAELDDFLKRNRNDFGKVQWRLEKLPITMDIFTPKTQRMILSREGGSSNPFQVPRDAERHAQQLKIIQQKGVSEEPIIVAKLSNGYDLIEGWHRTIQHLKEFPQGYTAPAWVGYGATYPSESVEQAVAEGLLNEFAPVGGDDRESDEEELLRQLASMWWLGTEQQMVKAQKTLAAMGWEIGQDESGDDDAGVFVIRVGDVNGDSYMAFPHSELNLNEGLSKGN